MKLAYIGYMLLALAAIVCGTIALCIGMIEAAMWEDLLVCSLMISLMFSVLMGMYLAIEAQN